MPRFGTRKATLFSALNEELERVLEDLDSIGEWISSKARCLACFYESKTPGNDLIHLLTPAISMPIPAFPMPMPIANATSSLL